MLLSEISDAVVQFSDFQNRPRLRHLDFKLVNKVKPLLALVNNLTQRLPTSTLSETNTLVFAIAYVLTSKVTSPAISKNVSGTSPPPWKLRLQNKVQLMHKEISQLSAFQQRHSSHLDFKLSVKYHIQERGLSAAIEDAKQRLLALSHRLRRYEARCTQYRQNNTF